MTPRAAARKKPEEEEEVQNICQTGWKWSTKCVYTLKSPLFFRRRCGWFRFTARKVDFVALNTEVTFTFESRETEETQPASSERNYQFNLD